MWLICLHVVVCVCLYGLYRDDMSQGSTEYWVASSAVHPSKTLDFGSLGEKPHGGFRFLSWSKWRWPLYVLSLEASSCICDPNTLQNIADMFQIAAWDILRHIETIHVWISASNLAGLVFHGFPVKRTADELPPPRFEAMTECVRAWPLDAAKHHGTQPQSPSRFDC